MNLGDHSEVSHENLIDVVFGGMPRGDFQTTPTLLHRHIATQHHGVFSAGTVTENWNVRCSIPVSQWRGISFPFLLYLPPRPVVRSVIVCGDGGWKTLSDQILVDCLAGGHGLALFDRTIVAPDRPVSVGDAQRDAPLYAALPDQFFGAISAWAWSYHRVLDALRKMPAFAQTPLVFTGHSRGGKAALLAGATEPRVWLTHANNAGAAGSGSFHVMGEGSESWQALARAFPHWLGPKIRALAESRHATALAFDQDLLLGQIAPRGLLITQAQGDAWANPKGTRHIVDKLRRRYQSALLSGGEGRVSEGVELVERDGHHPMRDADWSSLLASIDRRLCNANPAS